MATNTLGGQGFESQIEGNGAILCYQLFYKKNWKHAMHMQLVRGQNTHFFIKRSQKTPIWHSPAAIFQKNSFPTLRKIFFWFLSNLKEYVIAVTIFFSILNKLEFRLGQNKNKNCHYDPMLFNLKVSIQFECMEWKVILKQTAKLSNWVMNRKPSEFGQ